MKKDSEKYRELRRSGLDKRVGMVKWCRGIVERNGVNNREGRGRKEWYGRRGKKQKGNIVLQGAARMLRGKEGK